MPTISSIGPRTIAMFATLPEIRNVPSLQKINPLLVSPLQTRFHQGWSLRRIAREFTLPKKVVADLKAKFAFGLMSFRNRPEMINWLMRQSTLCQRELFGYYQKSGPGFRLWGNMGWGSAAPALVTRKQTFHTHPAGEHTIQGPFSKLALSPADVFIFFALRKQIETTVASGKGATTVRKVHPELADQAGNYLRQLTQYISRCALRKILIAKSVKRDFPIYRMI